MASTLTELQYRQGTLSKRLERLLSLQSMMANPDKQLENDIRLTRLSLDDVRKQIDSRINR
jgi:hypothetical protein